MKLTLTENALLVLRKRILARGQQGNIVETPEEMFRRVARHVASADLAYGTTADASTYEQTFFKAMANLEFLPNSPTLMNAGRELGQLSACFVLPVEDSMESIFGTLADTALIQKSGGGTGFSFSRLRPKNDPIASTAGESSGPVSFIRLYNFATEVTKLGGKRSGANMAILRVDHPDIEEFIAAKTNSVELNTFNISVAVTDEFMKKVEGGAQYQLVNPRTGSVVGELDARTVFSRIAGAAWRNGEPGVVFVDRINRDNPTPELGPIESTNPCGEQPLLPYESCVLGSINLSKFHYHGEIDYERLKEIVAMGVHFLDNIIDVSRFPIAQIDRMTRANRKIGLGVMGWADLLIQLGISYNSAPAIDLAEQVMEFIASEAIRASVELAKSRGPFPRFLQESMYRGNGYAARRNATVTTVAPTGTLSLIADCSSGIEPIYSIAYRRLSFQSDEMLFVHRLFEKYAHEQGFYSESLMQAIARQGSLRDLSAIPPGAQRLFVTAHEISPEWHIRMQAAFQKHIDAAVSKTINFPSSARVSDIEDAYLLAYKLGCKGLTAYRDRSREQQVLSTGLEQLDESVTLAAASQPETQSSSNLLLAKNKCPECGVILRHNGGCVYCVCGYSACLV